MLFLQEYHDKKLSQNHPLSTFKASTNHSRQKKPQIQICGWRTVALINQNGL